MSSRWLFNLFGNARTRVARSAICLPIMLCITGCDQLGIETPQKAAERVSADAKAVGGACRHALRAIEDCYVLNPKADKSAVFDGWREMDEYMRENKLEGIVPVVPRPVSAAASKAAAAASKASADGEGEDGATDAKDESAAPSGETKSKSH